MRGVGWLIVLCSVAAMAACFPDDPREREQARGLEGGAAGIGGGAGGGGTGPCSHLSSAPDGCTACAHDCLGGACLEGSCQPFLVLKGESGITQLALDATQLFWTSSGQGRLGVVTLAGEVGQTMTGLPSPWGIAVDSQSIYWTDSDGLHKSDKALGSRVDLASSGTDYASSVVVRGDYVYWIDDELGIRQIPVGGGQTTTLVQSLSTPALDLEVDTAGAVYWPEMGEEPFHNGTVNEGAHVLGIPMTRVLATGQAEPVSTALQGDTLYWANLGGSIQRLRLPEGTPELFVDEQTEPNDLALDSEFVYWTSAAGSGALRRAPLQGGPATDVASDLAFPRALVVNETALYWATEEGIMGIAK